jgi:hypothetical protein
LYRRDVPPAGCPVPSIDGCLVGRADTEHDAGERQLERRQRPRLGATTVPGTAAQVVAQESSLMYAASTG